MDFLQMKQGDLEQIWAKINENQFIFHPSLSPYGQIDIGPFLHQRFSRKPIEIIIDNMSRVAHCIDNGPMEGFWGILKREKYYSKRFISKKELVRMIRDYIYYYNTQRVQRNLGVVTPMEKFQMAFAA